MLTAQFVTGYRGFEISSEGADIILDDVRSNGYPEYANKEADEAHEGLALAATSTGVGHQRSGKSAKMIASGMTPLTELVGLDSANAALNALKNWSKQISVPIRFSTRALVNARG